VTTARIDLTRIGRWFRATTVAGVVLLALGCAAAPGPLKTLAPFGKNSSDESLRKRVEADSFPTAQKAGL
jgi:hypothetical protein